MRRHPHSTLLAGLILFALIVPQLPAPIFGLFPGLEELITRSDDIVVVEITATAQERIERAGVPDHPQSGLANFGLYSDFEVRVLRSILGDLEEGEECVIGLRYLRFFSGQLEASDDSQISRVSSFGLGTHHLLFLQREASFSPYNPLGEPAIAFSQNCEGAHFPIAPGTDLFPELVASPEVVIDQIIRYSTGRWQGEETRRVARLLEIHFLGEEPSSDLALEEMVQRIAASAEAGDTEYFAALLGDPLATDPALQLIEQIKSSEIAETYRDHISERSDNACHLNCHWLERGCHFQADLIRVDGEWRVERFWFCR
jgi:hypothetical protein